MPCRLQLLRWQVTGLETLFFKRHTYYNEAGSRLTSPTPQRSLNIIMCRKVQRAVMIDQSESHTIDPTDSSEYIFVYGFIGEKVNRRMSDNIEHNQFHLVPVGLEAAIRSTESLMKPATKVQTQGLGNLTPENAVRRTGIDARRDANHVRTGPHFDRNGRSQMATGTCLPAAKRQVILRYACKKWFSNSRRMCSGANRCKPWSVRDELTTMKSNPLAGECSGLPCEPLQFRGPFIGRFRARQTCLTRLLVNRQPNSLVLRQR